MNNLIRKFFNWLIRDGFPVTAAHQCYQAIDRETKDPALRAQAKARVDRWLMRGCSAHEALSPVLAWLRCECREAELRRGAVS